MVEIVQKLEGCASKSLEAADVSSSNVWLRLLWCDLGSNREVTPAGDGGRALQLLSAGMRSTILMRVDVNDNGGNDAGSVTVLQESLDSVRDVGRVHHTEAANITDIRVP